MRLLVFNAGSSSLKFDLLDVPAAGPSKRLIAGAFVDAADGSGRFVLRAAAAPTPCSPPTARTLAEAAGFVLAWLRDTKIHGRDWLEDLAASVHRIVHGGAKFHATTRLGSAELAALAELSPLAPLHNPPALAVIASVRERLGPALPLIGVFDTAYYAELPESAVRYAVPDRWWSEFGIRRYGFHGTAHRYLVQTACAHLKLPVTQARIISLQLGRGCSVTATQGGRAVATSMGFTPLEGLVMGTRSGDVDPGAVLYMAEHSGLSAAELGRQLNEESGLLALSGRTADMRELLARLEAKDAKAALAVEVFCRRARHGVGAYLAELGGADAVVFGGGIGENAPEIRRRILASFAWAGIELQAEANAAAVGISARISTPDGRTAVLVIPVDEASVIATEAAALL